MGGVRASGGKAVLLVGAEDAAPEYACSCWHSGTSSSRVHFREAIAVSMSLSELASSSMKDGSLTARLVAASTFTGSGVVTAAISVLGAGVGGSDVGMNSYTFFSIHLPM
ncbi:hypothetical protein MRX96_046171 [Rhipicephalus microplus]